MQRIAIIIPFSNMAVEYELQRKIKNKNLFYQIFKIDYTTHQKEDEENFYNELKANLETLINKVEALQFDKIILLCSSLNSKFNFEMLESINDIVVNFIKENNLNYKLVLFSPYSEKTTKETLKAFHNLGVCFKSVINNELLGSINYFNFGNYIVQSIKEHNLENEKIFVSCTNIPVIDAQTELKDIVSSNTILIDYLNSI